MTRYLPFAEMNILMCFPGLKGTQTHWTYLPTCFSKKIDAHGGDGFPGCPVELFVLLSLGRVPHAPATQLFSDTGKNREPFFGKTILVASKKKEKGSH